MQSPIDPLGQIDWTTRSESAADERTHHQISGRPERPIHRMSTGEKGHDWRSAPSQFQNRASDQYVARIDHSASSEVSQRLGFSSEFEIDVRQIQIEIGIEKFLFRRGFTERSRLFEVS